MLEDLRSFIGGFFLIVGWILYFEGMFHPVLTEGVNLNVRVGEGFIVFGVLAWASFLLTHRNSTSVEKRPNSGKKK